MLRVLISKRHSQSQWQIFERKIKVHTTYSRQIGVPQYRVKRATIVALCIRIVYEFLKPCPFGITSLNNIFTLNIKQMQYLAE